MSFHDAFTFDKTLWGQLPTKVGAAGGSTPADLARGNLSSLVSLDTHNYFAWADPSGDADGYQKGAVGWGGVIQGMESAGTRVIVGEWSLALDTCTMWLEGFNYVASGHPGYECEEVACPLTDGKATEAEGGKPCTPMYPPVRTAKDAFGPTRDCMCPSSSKQTDAFVTAFASQLLWAYGQGSGWFFWNFRSELGDPKWSYVHAVERGWIPKDLSPFRRGAPAPAVQLGLTLMEPPEAVYSSSVLAIVAMSTLVVGLAGGVCLMKLQSRPSSSESHVLLRDDVAQSPSSTSSTYTIDGGRSSGEASPSGSPAAKGQGTAV